MMCALAPKTPAENVAQPLKLLSRTLVESIKRTQSRIFRRYPALQLSHQRRKQRSKYFSGTLTIGRRQRRLRHRAAPEVIELAGVALQVGFDLTQASQTAKLRVQHRDQMRLGLPAAPIAAVGTVLLHKLIDHAPRNLLQKFMKDDILMPHGFDPP